MQRCVSSEMPIRHLNGDTDIWIWSPRKGLGLAMLTDKSTVHRLYLTPRRVSS